MRNSPKSFSKNFSRKFWNELSGNSFKIFSGCLKYAAVSSDNPGKLYRRQCVYLDEFPNIFLNWSFILLEDFMIVCMVVFLEKLPWNSCRILEKILLDFSPKGTAGAIVERNNSGRKVFQRKPAWKFQKKNVEVFR